MVAVVGLALFAAACGAPPGPVGWAGAVPVKVDAQRLILVSHKSHLYALRDESSNASWQFPPKDKNSYPVSTETSAKLSATVDALSIDAAAKAEIQKNVKDLTVAGPSGDALKKAITDSGASDGQKSTARSLVDAAVKFENGALGNLQALYGDTGVSADGKTAFVPTFRGMVFALDTGTGNVRWVRNAGAGIVGGVVVDGDAIYFGTKANRLFSLDAISGEQRWAFKTKGEVWATPTVEGDTIYATSLDGSLYAIDKAGKQKWVFASASSGIASRPVIAGDAIYVGAFDNKLYSVKKTDGTMNWSIKADNWFWAAPVVRDGIVYAASLDGKVYAVDASTGAKTWEPFDTGSAVRAAPVVAGGGLIVAAKSGRVYKLDLLSGQPADGGAPVELGVSVLANLTSDGDKTVYVVPSSATLYVLDATGVLGAPGSFPLPQ
jgi:outer membrane protein assembly factor BamB